ncbi:MAG: phosphoenolpyruvate--protein phosphotransferase [Sulfobacillus sp.]|nr:phosphoenolpyruvate--protein phosphotransferase [Sulfobacillus sp.]
MSRTWSGIPASPGFAIGPARIWVKKPPTGPGRQGSRPAEEKARFEAALQESRDDLTRLYTKALETAGADTAAIFEAHQAMLDDPGFQALVSTRIEEDGLSAEAAVEEAVEELASLFTRLDDPYLRQRAADVRDMGQRVIRHLVGDPLPTLPPDLPPAVIVADDLLPSDTVEFDKKSVLGFVTVQGGKTSHSTIIAQTLGIPAVVGLPPEILTEIHDNDTVIVDGETGRVIARPLPSEEAPYQQKVRDRQQWEAGLQSLIHRPTVTQDGHRIELVANIATLNDVKAALEHGTEGIGLFRTEFLFMNRDTLPSEDEQYQVYRTVVEQMAGRPTIIRTLDIGGDKEVPALHLAPEANPFLGYRAIRLCLDRPELFLTQLRALYRAAQHGPIGIMFPMVTTRQEITEARRLLNAAKDDVEKKGVAVPRQPQVGIMIETPAAALMADRLAAEVDFFSIGTNDLTQYTMACDRLNPTVSALYQPYHPALLRLIRHVIEGAHHHQKWVGLCGEMASDPIAIPLLLGLGLDEFSVNPGKILPTRARIAGLNRQTLQTLAEAALDLDEAEDVRQLVEGALGAS